MAARPAAIAGSVLGALVGFATAIVVVLNLHIMLGLAQGYAASPGDVWDKSPVLAVVDLALLVGLPMVGVVIAPRLRRHP